MHYNAGILENNFWYTLMYYDYFGFGSLDQRMLSCYTSFKL